jgi:hypothetical protein
MAKELEGSELLETAYPSDGISITIFDRSIGKRKVAARSVHPGQLKPKPSSSPGTQIFNIDGYLLPHQGALNFWQKDRAPEQEDRGPEQAGAGENDAPPKSPRA